jgi:hypothetical protein
MTLQISLTLLRQNLIAFLTPASHDSVVSMTLLSSAWCTPGWIPSLPSPLPSCDDSQCFLAHPVCYSTFSGLPPSPFREPCGKTDDEKGPNLSTLCGFLMSTLLFSYRSQPQVTGKSPSICCKDSVLDRSVSLPQLCNIKLCNLSVQYLPDKYGIWCIPHWYV